MKKIILIAFVLTLIGGGLRAQEEQTEPPKKLEQLLTPSKAFSHKKLAYITLQDGTEIKGNIQDVDREKGLIEGVKVKDGKGKKHKLKPEDIKHMYLPPSGLDKLGNAMDIASDAKKWNNQRLKQDLVNQGYIYFEQTEVKIKKKTETLLVQLLNPTFCSKISVYHDPKAKETFSVGVAGVEAVGGIAKSYYIKKDTDEVAYKLTKKDYQKQFVMFWSNCKFLVKKYGASPKWRDLTEHIHKYNEQ